MKIIELSKKHFLEKFEKGKSQAFPFLPRHVENVEMWAKKLLVDYPETDREILFVSVWLHDIGQTIGNKSTDHAVKSEREARKFLSSLKYSKAKIDKVAHCVRSHRVKDVLPKTIEAKILVASDSASHFTDINYIVHLTDKSDKFGRSYTKAKIERDFRDINILPGLRKELTPLYKAWKELFKAFPKL